MLIELMSSDIMELDRSGEIYTILVIEISQSPNRNQTLRFSIRSRQGPPIPKQTLFIYKMYDTYIF